MKGGNIGMQSGVMMMVDALRSLGVVSGGGGCDTEFGTSGACWGGGFRCVL